MPLKFINERTMFKVLIEGRGALVSITTKNRAFFLFFTYEFVGGRTAPTTDPDPGIVELCDYDIKKILASWDRLSRVRVAPLPGKKGEA